MHGKLELVGVPVAWPGRKTLFVCSLYDHEIKNPNDGYDRDSCPSRQPLYWSRITLCAFPDIVSYLLWRVSRRTHRSDFFCFDSVHPFLWVHGYHCGVQSSGYRDLMSSATMSLSVTRTLFCHGGCAQEVRKDGLVATHHGVHKLQLYL
jgi:hypothetical protein